MKTLDHLAPKITLEKEDNSFYLYDHRGEELIGPRYTLGEILGEILEYGKAMKFTTIEGPSGDYLDYSPIHHAFIPRMED